MPESFVKRTFKFMEKFENLAPCPTFIVVSSTSGESMLAEQHAAAMQNFSLLVKNLSYSNPKYAMGVHDVQGYYLSTEKFLQDKFLSADNMTSLIAINFYLETDSFGKDFSMWLQDQLPINAINSSTLRYDMTGIGLLFDDIVKGTRTDFVRIEVFSVPVAVIILAYCMKSLRVLIIPAVCLPLSLVLSFAIMLPFTYAMDVCLVAPELMGAAVSAFNIDYALFLVSRFQEQINTHQLNDLTDPAVQLVIVKRTMRLAAHNIIVSGIVVAMAGGSSMVFPIDTVRTLGVGFYPPE